MEKSKIIRALATVNAPNSSEDLVSGHLLRDVTVEGNNVTFKLELPAMDAQTKQDLNFACQQAILAVYPEAQVHAHMLTSAPTVGGPTKPKNPLPQVRNIIAVASGKGGVGKSTVAVNLALALQELGGRVGLLDADVYGPSAPTMMGLAGQKPQVENVNGKPQIKPLYAYGIPVMSTGFLIEPDKAVVLRGPRLSGIVKQFIEDTLWPPLDYLIVDLPPGTGDVQLTLVQVAAVTGAVMVTTPQEVALVDAVKAMNMFRLDTVQVPILGVVENMAWFTPAELPDKKYYIFGEGGGKQLARKSNSMLLGQVPLVQGIREGGDSGAPAAADPAHPAHEYFMKIARNVVRQTAVRNELLPPTAAVQMQV